MAVSSNSTTASAAKALRPELASAFTFQMLASTDRIGGTVYDTKYARELLTVDPVAKIEDDCLAVVVLNGGAAFLVRIGCDGRDFDGRFVKRGSDNEAFRIHYGVSYRRADQGDAIYVVGRVVGEDRAFPR